MIQIMYDVESEHSLDEQLLEQHQQLQHEIKQRRHRTSPDDDLGPLRPQVLLQGSTSSANDHHCDVGDVLHVHVCNYKYMYGTLAI